MRIKALACFYAVTVAGPCLAAQNQSTYFGVNITGQLTLLRVVDVSQLSQRAVTLHSDPAVLFGFRNWWDVPSMETSPKLLNRRLRFLPDASDGPTQRAFRAGASLPLREASVGAVSGLPVIRDTVSFGFPGLTHADQRLANGGNQFSVEPPNPSIAVANGYILQGVNNAIQVFTVTGSPVLPKVLSSNELFGVPAAIDYSTGINGVFPTDMRVFHDQTINRWFVLQRVQDYDLAGATLLSSRMFLAVSQSPDPVGAYNIYSIDTTDSGRPGCPCVADYPQIGADQNGFYISSGQYNIIGEYFINAQIHAISKASLAAGAASPTMVRFALPFTTGYEFSIQPATTPAGAQFFTGSNGVEYLASTQARATADDSIAIYAIENTASLATASPSLALTQRIVPIIPYTFPDVASQRPGPLPYGSSLSPPRFLTFIDGGDLRVQALSYAGGRLYTSFSTQLIDEAGRQVVGGAFAILSPTYRNGVLAAPVYRQGYYAVKNNHLLRPGIGVNAQGQGVIAATLVGPDYFPSAVYLPLTPTTGPVSVQMSGPGTSPQDGFSGYRNFVARWGDYTTTVVASDGSVWSTAEYIPNAPRTERANWGTYVTRYVP